MKKETKEITIKKEVSPIVHQVGIMEIRNAENMNVATSALSQLNSYLDALTVEKEKLTKPINEALKEIRGRYKPTELMLTEAILMLKNKMGAYQMQALKEQREAEAKIADQLASGKIKKVDTALKKMALVESPDEKIKTEDGSASFRPVKKFEVVDMTMLPVEYHLADEIKIRKAMLAGIELPGVRYYEELSVINRRQ